MAENREFIAAKDLPVTEAEEVDVVVVDPATGELGLKAGANLGGGGNSEADLVIRINRRFDSATPQTSDAVITYGSYEKVLTAFEEGRLPSAKIQYYSTETNLYSATAYETNASIYYYNGYFALYALIPNSNPRMITIVFASDGTISNISMKTISVS